MTGRMFGRKSRIPTTIAGLALVAASVAACGSDDGSDTTASDPTAPTTSASSPSASETPTESSSPVSSDAPSDDPVPSPIIDKAVKDALKDQFPALVPSGVPAGWSVVSAQYDAQGGGTWTIAFTSPKGTPVTLLQNTGSAADLVAQLVPGAQKGGTVRISGTGKWDVYTSSAATAFAKDLSGTGAVIAGADPETVATIVDQLLTAEDSGNVDGG